MIEYIIDIDVNYLCLVSNEEFNIYYLMALLHIFIKIIMD